MGEEVRTLLLCKLHVPSAICSSFVYSSNGGSTAMEDQRDKRFVPTVSEVLEDGTIIELLYRSEEHETRLALFNAGSWTTLKHVESTWAGTACGLFRRITI